MESATKQRLRAELEDTRRELVDELRRLGADPDSSKVRRLDEVDDNFADAASATQERAEALLSIEKFSERLADVDRPLSAWTPTATARARPGHADPGRASGSASHERPLRRLCGRVTLIASAPWRT